MRKTYLGVTDFDWHEYLAHATDGLGTDLWQPLA
jgi:hypothetical protein